MSVGTVSTVVDPATAGSTKKDEAKDINDRFLKLLVAQMKNQDPLNPLDNAQVTTQMAQISTVTGINNLTDTVARLLDQFNGLQTLQAAQLAGREVLVAGNRLQVTADGAGGGAVDLPVDAGSVTVDIRDANGVLVRSLDLGQRGAGLSMFEWDGRNEAGVAVAPGNYSFSARALLAGNEYAVDTLNVARVDGVRSSNGTVQLVLAGLGTVSYTDVKQIL